MSLDFRSSLDDSAFVRSLRNMEAKTKTAASSIGDSFKAAQGSLTALAGGLGVFAGLRGAKEIVDFAGEIADSADAVSLTAEQFQGFSGVLEQSGVDAEKFTRGMVSLNAKIQDAKDGNEAAIKSFSRLGVSLEQLKTDDPGKVLLAIADGLKNATDKSEANAAALDILGTKQYKMASALKMGSEELQRQAELTSKLSDKETERLDSLGDGLSRIARTIKALGGKGLLALGDNFLATVDEMGGLAVNRQKADNRRYMEQREQDRAARREAAAGKIPGLNVPFEEGGDTRTDAEKARDAAFDADLEKEKAQAKIDSDKEREKSDAEYTSNAIKNSIAIEQAQARANEIARATLVDGMEGEKKIAALEEDRAQLQNQMATASDEEKADIVERIAQKEREIALEKRAGEKRAEDAREEKAQQDAIMQGRIQDEQLRIGLMSPDERRAAFRNMKREERAANRAERMRGFFDNRGVWHQPQEGRAFANKLLEKQLMELSPATIVAITRPMVDVNDTLKDRLRPTKL